MNRRIGSSKVLRSLGFTLIELLVAITIIVALVVVTLPSFTSLIQSANFSAAISQTTASLGSARAIAMRDGVQTAVAFLFDTQKQEYTLVILVESATGQRGVALEPADGSTQSHVRGRVPAGTEHRAGHPS